MFKEIPYKTTDHFKFYYYYCFTNIFCKNTFTFAFYNLISVANEFLKKKDVFDVFYTKKSNVGGRPQ